MPQEGQNERIEMLKKRIDDLKKRFPAHSLKAGMFLELEQLQEELDMLLGDAD